MVQARLVAAVFLAAAVFAAHAARVEPEDPWAPLLTPGHMRELKNSFAKHLEGQQQAKKDAATAYAPEYHGPHEHYEGPHHEDEEYHHHEEDYYKPVKTESICFKEVYRKDCTEFGGGVAPGPDGNFTFSPAGRNQM